MKIKEMVKVSVIVPVFNAEKYLDECMESLLNQTLSDIEILCINDGSTDGSLNLMKEYARNDIRVRCIDKVNEGYGKTVNLGIDEAKGDYVAIVEPDDYVSEFMFEKLFAKAVQYGLEVVKGDFAEFTGSDLNKTVVNRKIIGNESVYNKEVIPALIDDFFRGYIMNSSGIYKKEFLNKFNIRFNETPGAAFQDQGFWFQIMQSAAKLMLMDEVVYYYRQDNPNSSINSKEKIYCICDEYKFILNKLDNILKGQYLCCMINNYFGTYRRIKDEFKLEFLKRFSNDIRRLEDGGMIDESFLIEDERDRYLSVRDDYVKFYDNSMAFPRYLHNSLRDCSKVLVYGAGDIGNRIINALNENDRCKIEAFVVSDVFNNAKKVGGFDVKRIEEYLDERDTATVIIAVTKRYYSEIHSVLVEKGFKNIITIPENLL